MTRRSVVVVDDHAMFRTGVKAELGAHPDAVDVLGEAADVDEAVAAVSTFKPDVVLLDVHLPGVADVRRSASRRITSAPPPPGRCTSSSTTSGRSRVTAATASSTSAASPRTSTASG